MAIIPYAQYAPDLASFDAGASDNIKNVVPKPGSYGPLKKIAPISDALPAQPRGAFAAHDGNGTLHVFAGTLTKLYKFNQGTAGWDDVSGGATFAVPSDSAWTFASFGNAVLANNKTDGLYAYTIGTSTNFAAVTAAPKANTMNVVGDFVVLGDLSTNSRQVQWSGLNDYEHWTPRQKLSDFQVFPDGEEVVAVVPFAMGGLVFQRRAVREMTPALNTPLIFQFQQKEANRGAVARDSVVTDGRFVFYMADDGFYAYGLENPGIGAFRVNETVVNDIDASSQFMVQGTPDPASHMVWWRYKSTASASTTTTDKMIGYNWAVDRWVTADVTLSWMFASASQGYTLEQLDDTGYTLETLPFSLDSRVWMGGAPLIAGFDENFKMGVFNGGNMEATLQTADIHLPTTSGMPGMETRRAFARGFRPISDASTIHGRVGVKDRPGGTRTFNTEAQAHSSTGIIPCRSVGLTHRFENRIPEDEAWEDTSGVSVDFETEGER